MFDSILVICTGNICRSPIAERMLRNLLPNKKVDSAGINAMIDHPADSTAIQISEKNSLSLAGHKGVQFTSNLGRQYDLLLVMEHEHIEKIGRIAPELRGKTMLLGHWTKYKEIPDPYRKSDEAFASVFDLIKESCLSWAEKLER
ncbi:TPA: protein tyrosine phosphatase [Raoultella ornithinolytica]|uniref:arsenate reductase/protein-tyrosine-phosphatase family protein n=1 Tax=Raoultella ornithinolytica TaxID=54291 RepID=UPI000CF33FE4|nr:protein tyrosine phosphatase [Raoultella ornithinolytica]MCW9578490.1 protein tyrosine phosphatase [Raoultella ornithinolytica]PQH21692.1 protein tyrosine phosphatase [Raoultella ornithinolytica]HBZ9026560.1 protein tyrosine phosphatase [Raoultella ornithinolytica]HCA0181278.1 protein tyrosine phosphatase [Raoultella ornithinolytica]HCA0806871.1 protein tyrosine phosphatase [Raoultella ornithinolytica]